MTGRARAGTLTVPQTAGEAFDTDGMVLGGMVIDIRDGEIRCDNDAFRKRLNTGAWIPAAAVDGSEAYRGDLYADPEAGPGQVRSLVAEIWSVNGAWQMRMHGTVIDGAGQEHSGTIGKHYTNLSSVSSAKMQGTRTAHHFARGSATAFTPDPADGAWQAGDWVIDASGSVWVRAADDDAAAGLAWGQPPAMARGQHGGQSTVSVPAGSTADDVPVRPLVLLIRNGFPVLP